MTDHSSSEEQGQPGRPGGGEAAGSEDCAEASAPAVKRARRSASSRQRRHQFPARNRSVFARFTDGEYDALVSAANRSDLSTTAFVATAAVAAATGTQVPGSPMREALVELMQARTAAVRIGQATNKLAAKALAGGEVTAGELAAAVEASARAVARIEGAAARVERGLA